MEAAPVDDIETAPPAACAVSLGILNPSQVDYAIEVSAMRSVVVESLVLCSVVTLVCTVQRMNDGRDNGKDECGRML